MRLINYRFIRYFTVCWVPDFKGRQNIAGSLSHPAFMPGIPVTYIGPLSRFEHIKEAQVKYKWLVLLSGPEPQRTLLEDLMLSHFSILQQEQVLFVRGLPASTTLVPQVYPHILIVNHLPTLQLQQAFNQSEYVISRSGYTTVMEVLSLQKKAIIIPTPGQTEQQYLGAHLMQQQWCYSFQQHQNIAAHLHKAQLFKYRLPVLPATSLKDNLEAFLKTYVIKKVGL